MGKKQKKSGDDSAKDGGIDLDALAAEIEGAGASKEQGKGKAKKKKDKKKDDFDEDDILKELEELSLETTGAKGSKVKCSHMLIFKCNDPIPGYSPMLICICNDPIVGYNRVSVSHVLPIRHSNTQATEGRLHQASHTTLQ
ncbi:unnamed protein product [Oncorhynchus mykiss]|uniref:Uncharacterized protein n=1 Tax=Oncorhynchus mykiss TaxID=8022 RepID=A0A060Y196_ONCMY|nr:unnamed protein product [Oncorhynchus mykiss]